MTFWIITFAQCVIVILAIVRVARIGYRQGVLEGMMIGRYEKKRQREVAVDFPKAQKIVDEFDSRMAWKIAVDSESMDQT